MTNGQVIQYIRRIFRANPPSLETDGQLLDAFVQARDEAAFAALVRRHGPLVFGVCRRVLHQWQDAEDAFQAVFLVLARKAGSIRRREQLANWLYGVAYRTALKARSTSLHRRQRETDVADDPCAPTAEASPDEDVRRILDEEIHRLPTNYRAAVVACYLDGKTYEEAARSLGCPKGTVSIRLTRAREMLRNRLSRRGLGLPMTTIAAVTVPPALADAAIKTGIATVMGPGTAVVSSTVVDLARGVMHAMFISKLKFAGLVALVVTTLVVGAGAAAMRVFAPNESKHDPAPPAVVVRDKPNPKPADDQLPTHPLTITGTATDENGKPVKGATVYLLSLANHLAASDGKKRPCELVATTETDDRGEYTFRDLDFPMVRARSEPDVWGKFQLAATAPGRGLDWSHQSYFFNYARPAKDSHGEDLKYLGEPIHISFKLCPAEELKGRLVDETGKPLEGVRLQIRLADYLRPWNRVHGVGQPHGHFEAMWIPGSVAATRTDKDGRFRLPGLPRDAFFLINAEHAELSHVSFYAATGEIPVPDEVERLAHHSSLTGKPPILTGELALTLARPKKISLRVLTSDTKENATHVRVSATGMRQVNNSSHSETGDDGIANLRLPPGEFHVLLDPPRDSDCVRTETTIKVSDAPEQSFEVRIQRGTVVIFDVIDSDTGKGIPNMQFATMHDNRWMRVDESTHRSTGKPRSDANSKFRAVMNPGKREFKVGWDRFVDLVPFPPEEWDIVPEPNDPTETAAGIKQVELPEGKTVHVRFKLRRKAS